MKNQRSIFSLILVFIFLLGCSNVTETEEQVMNDIENKDQIILVQKRVGDENKYEGFKEVTDPKQVLNIKKIVKDTDWELAEVEMDRPPDYKFHFKSDPVQHAVWISPNQDHVEIVMEGQSKYAKLTKENSTLLFEVITGEKLGN